VDFFASQDLARRNTRRLIIWLILSILCMIAAIYAVIMIVLASDAGRALTESGLQYPWLNPGILAAVAIGVLGVVGAGSLYKIASLRGGGAGVAALLGGRRLPPNASEPDERKILNIVEEMALASGMPVPPVYVLENEPGINAFAAGYNVDDAVIGVNRGTIEQLNRDELQGVVAHEFSHILNGDMRMSLRMIGVLHGIQLLSLIGYYVLRGSSSGRSSSRKGGGQIAIVALALIVVGFIGLFFARLIKASISRQREYLADASAVQFTRNPDGIAGALKMIGASVNGSVVTAAQAEEASHMFFGSMFRSSGLFDTHPPLADRIRKLDPRFDGDFSEYRRKRERRLEQREASERKASAQFPGMGTRFAVPGFPGMFGDRFPLDPTLLIAGIGDPDFRDVEYSAEIVDRIPDQIRDAARDLFSARCLVLASLLNRDPQVRAAQFQVISGHEGDATIQETMKLSPLVDALAPRFRLPLFEILQGALTGLSPEQYTRFRKTVDDLVTADQRVDLFEFFLRHHLIVHLDRYFGRLGPPHARYRSVEAVRTEVNQLLGMLIRAGHDSPEAALAAHRQALQSLEVDWPVEVPAELSYADLARSLKRLAAAMPQVKKRFLSAAAVAILHDGEVTVEEAELFRALSESLDCPVPPVAATGPRESRPNNA
jgi:Zn-dependent protease with chaperone function